MKQGDRTLVIGSSDRVFAEAAGEYLRERHGWRLLGIASDGIQVLDLVRRHTPSAVLMLGDLPRLGAPAVAEEINRRARDMGIVTVGSAVGATLPENAGADTIASALEQPPPASRAGSDRRATERLRLRALTPRERRVMLLVARGESMSQIASTLGVSTHTVRTHLQNLYLKLGIHRRVDLVAFAARHGLVAVDTDRSR